VYESVSRSDNAASIGGAPSVDGATSIGGAPKSYGVSVVVARALEVLRGGRSALVSDVDGTISPIVERPAEAIVSTSTD
jgi:hypothetical protein